jgi:hypothetical protein
MISPLRQGFLDLRFIIQDMVTEGSRVVVRMVYSAQLARACYAHFPPRENPTGQLRELS